MFLSYFKEATLGNHLNVEVTGKFEVDSFIYDITSDAFDHYYTNKIDINGVYKDNEFSLLFQNKDEAKHEFSIEFRIIVDINLYNITYSQHYFTIYNEKETTIYNVDETNVHLTVSGNEIIITQYTRFIEPNAIDSVRIFKSLENYKFDEDINIRNSITSNHIEVKIEQWTF